jgi:hypothetical protein
MALSLETIIPRLVEKRGEKIPCWLEPRVSEGKLGGGREGIYGAYELQSGILTVKDFSSGEQTKVPRTELAAFLAS